MTSLLSSSRRSICVSQMLQTLFILVCLPVSSLGFSNSDSITQRFVHRESHVASKCRSHALHLSRRSFNEVLVSRGRLHAPLQNKANRHSRLFYGDQAPLASSILQMTTADSSNEMSNSPKNPFVRVWLWFRQLLARIWVRGVFNFVA